MHCRHSNGDRCSIFVTGCHRYRLGRRRSAQYPDQRRRTNWAGPRPKPGRRRKQPERSGPPSASSPLSRAPNRGHRVAEISPCRAAPLDRPWRAALLVGAVHPHPQLGAGRGQVPEPDLAGDRTLHRRGANATRSTDSATRTGVDSRALAGHRRLRPSVLRSRRTLPSRCCRPGVEGEWSAEPGGSDRTEVVANPLSGPSTTCLSRLVGATQSENVTSTGRRTR